MIINLHVLICSSNDGWLSNVVKQVYMSFVACLYSYYWMKYNIPEELKDETPAGTRARSYLYVCCSSMFAFVRL